MRRKGRPLGRNNQRIRLNPRRWMRTATPSQLVLAAVTALLACLVVAAAMRYIILGFVIFGVVFMHIGGAVIGGVSLIDRFTAFTPPLWFPHLKWATAPMRILETGLMLYEELDTFSELIE